MLTHELLAPHTELLLRHDLFEGVPADALPDLVNALGGELKHYVAGENIMRMGRAPIVTGIILTGAVEVSFLNENADQIDMNIFEAGKSFGETMEGANLALQAIPVEEDGTAMRDLNQTQLARYLGVERSALSREMSHLRDEGIIDYDRKTLRVLNPDFLAI